MSFCNKHKDVVLEDATCFMCHGEGEIEDTESYGGEPIFVKCWQCHGTGEIKDCVCWMCEEEHQDEINC